MGVRTGVVTAVMCLIASTAHAVPSERLTSPERADITTRTDQKALAEAKKTKRASLLTYKGLGTWIDMYDAPPWKDPEGTIVEMAAHGVTTLYLQTANYRKPKRAPIYKPEKMSRMIDAAHAAGIKVVAWYVPGFRNMDKDKKRTKTALDFESATGQTFDSFAMDIEATLVGDIAKRNAAMSELSRWLRRKVGPAYALGGIVPDVQSLYWPSFPYAKVAKFYDVMMPMTYYSYRVSGANAVYSYVDANFREIRARTGDPAIRMHPIGGIGGQTSRREARAYVRALLDNGAMGGSYYDFPITLPREWEELYALRG